MRLGFSHKMSIYHMTCLYLFQLHENQQHFCGDCNTVTKGINVYILASENEFPEIIYTFFGGRQNIFSTIFGTKFVVKCAAKF